MENLTRKRQQKAPAHKNKNFAMSVEELFFYGQEGLGPLSARFVFTKPKMRWMALADIL